VTLFLCQGIGDVPQALFFCVCQGIVLRAVMLFFCTTVYDMPRHCRDVPQHCAACCSIMPKRFFVCGGTAICATTFFWCRIIVHFAIALFCG